MIHPLQAVVANSDGSIVFCVIKNMIQVFRWEQTKGEFVAAGRWIDEEDNTSAIKTKVTEEQHRQRAENDAKRRKIEEDTSINKSEDNAQTKKAKDAKVPVPGAGAPPVYNYVRNVSLSRDEKLLFACTDSDKALVVFALDFSDPSKNCLTVQKRQPLPKRPNALTTTTDGQKVLVADKFGDVYSVNARDQKVIGTTENGLEPILGHVSLLTDIALTTDSNGKQLLFTADRDEHIRITHFPQTYIIDKWLFGSKQFVSTLCLPQWGSNLLFSAGGDNFVSSWNWESGHLLDSLDISELIEPFLGDAQLAPERFQNETNTLVEYAVTEIVTLSNLPYIAFCVEQTKALFICKIDPTLGTITLAQTIELPCNIVSLTSASASNTFVAALDNRESGTFNFAIFISWDEVQFTIDGEKNICFDRCITEELGGNSIANFEGQVIYPLYHIGSLRKRGELYA
ncbi:LANO_0H05468g1_1 [Lachancea nothofagi CBS 11611]|uniref:LANO_0H05468g1_1 n=1 Tax=Lachancea nothofagi CBS 11611 TaxID=1266666 RepID=A0A1G4KLH4_9SACH|nr:LANO_0H05468g1_1 [Lachancea nothofagi CBS 11611]